MLVTDTSTGLVNFDARYGVFKEWVSFGLHKKSRISGARFVSFIASHFTPRAVHPPHSPHAHGTNPRNGATRANPSMRTQPRFRARCSPRRVARARPPARLPLFLFAFRQPCHLTIHQQASMEAKFNAIEAPAHHRAVRQYSTRVGSPKQRCSWPSRCPTPR